MNKTVIFASLLAVLNHVASPTPTHAAPRKQDRRASAIERIEAESKVDDLTVALPPSRLESIGSNHSLTASSGKTAATWKGVEFALSSWSPNQLRLDSLVPDSTAFSSGLPALTVNFLFSQESLGRLNPGPLSFGSLTPLLGVTFLSMNRSGTLQYSATQEKVEQSLFLVPVRIGARLSPNALQGRRLSPYFGLSLLPTFAIASRTALSDGSPLLGLPVEFALGTEFSVAGTPLDLGLVSTVGKLSTKNESGEFFGIGLFLGLKIGS